ncbi:MAG: hypothetical protein ABIA74_03445 [bacterium]
MFKLKNKFLIIISFLIFSNVFSLSVLQRLTNTFQGPALYIVQNQKEVKKGIKEPFYWITTNSSDSLDSAVCHEVSHTLVGYKLGFRITNASVYKDSLLRYAYVGKTEFELGGEEFKNKTEIDQDVLNQLSDEVLKNLICMALAGGLGTEIIYGQDYGMSGDDGVIDIIGAELIKRENNSLLDKVLLATKDLSFISKNDFKAKVKEIKKECYEKTKTLLIENRDTLEKLSKRLKNSSDKILNEDQIKEIIG